VPLRLIIVDDKDLICESLAARLDTEDDLEVVALCSSGREAVLRARALRPDVAIITYSLAGTAGSLETTMQLAQVVPECQVIILSELLDGDAILRSFRAGASNYVPTTTPAQRLIECIRAAPSGQTVLDPVVARRMVREVARQEQELSLSPMELQVLSLAADGLTNEEIGLRLHLGLSTTKRHLSASYEKLQAGGRQEAIERARKRGLLHS